MNTKEGREEGGAVLVCTLVVPRAHKMQRRRYKKILARESQVFSAILEVGLSHSGVAHSLCMYRVHHLSVYIHLVRDLRST